MDDGVEAAVCFVGAHSDALELFELAKEILNQVTPSRCRDEVLPTS